MPEKCVCVCVRVDIYMYVKLVPGKTVWLKNKM